MTSDPILLMGGSGSIGRLSARSLRARYPSLPLLIAGRDEEKASDFAKELGNAEAVVLKLEEPDLGLGTSPIGAVAVFYSDDRLAGLTFANNRSLPHLSISSGIFEIAPEVAVYMHRPDAGAVVLGYEWLVGATTVSVIELAKAFDRLDDIRMNALVDEEDKGGPAVKEDFERLGRLLPAALTRRGNVFVWREGEGASASFHAIDGTSITASGFSSIDVAGLAAATGARNVEFNIATATPSSRREGRGLSTEIIIGLSGFDHRGQKLATRHAVFHPGGAAPLTAIGVSMIIERLTGLDGRPPASPGLYFPYQLIDAATYFLRLEEEGGGLKALPPIVEGI